MTKNITLVAINYFPEDSSTGLYNTQMAEYLAKNGFNVDVLTGFPYYPQWRIKDSYKTRSTFIDEDHDGVKIHRYKQYVPTQPTFAKRILHLLDFTCGSTRNLFKVKKCDLVIAVVPFTTSIVLGLILAKMRGAKLWAHIQDFEFDAARDSGLTSGKGVSNVIFTLLMHIEAWLLGRADIVSTISYSMLEKLKTKTRTSTYFFPNWVDPAEINPATAKPHPFLQSNKFKVLYSGNIGAKQDWEFFIRIVEYYNHNEKFEFILVGDGAKRGELLDRISHLNNVSYHPPVDLSDLSNLLCSADLHILFQKGNVIDTVMPSKILGMMASAKPSIVTGNPLSEAAKLFDESKGGYFIDSKDFSTVIAHINSLQNNRDSAAKMGIAAREYVIEKFSSNKVLESFITQVSFILGEECN